MLGSITSLITCSSCIWYIKIASPSINEYRINISFVYLSEMQDIANFCQLYKCILRFILLISMIPGAIFNLSSTCVVLAPVAGRRECQLWPNSQQQMLHILFSHCSFQLWCISQNSASPLPMSIFKASDMHFNAYQCIVQPNTILHASDSLYRPIYGPGILLCSVDRCILGSCMWDPIHQANAFCAWRHHISPS